MPGCCQTYATGSYDDKSLDLPTPNLLTLDISQELLQHPRDRRDYYAFTGARWGNSQGSHQKRRSCSSQQQHRFRRQQSTGVRSFLIFLALRPFHALSVAQQLNIEARSAIKRMSKTF